MRKINMFRTLAILAWLVLGNVVMQAQNEVENVSASQCATYGRELFDMGMYSEAFPYVQKAAESGYGDAHLMAGQFYELGLGGVARNYEIALREYQKAAEQNKAMSFVRLGIMCENGKGCAANYKMAFNYYIKATICTDDREAKAVAYREAGRCYQCGIGVATDIEKAIECYDKAIESSDNSSFKNEVRSLKERARSEMRN